MKLIILDRDGVINLDSDNYIKSASEWHPIPGSMEAIARLNQSGYRVVVATNQAGISRGLFDIRTLNLIHNKLHQTAQAFGAHIDAIFFCPHAADEDCGCRKPKPGMLQSIGQRYDISLKNIIFVGDSLRDLQAGFSVGCTPYLVKTGKGTKTIDKGGLPPGTTIFQDLAAVVDALLQQKQLVTDTVESARLAIQKKNK
jgi:D-glycero-D-manno-heptose 1,7-bisphosphate phosphatase